MRVEKIFVGKPRDVIFEGKTVHTAIFKEEVDFPVKVIGNNLEGDKQADLRVHGGEFKALYAYSTQHYDWWRTQIGLAEIPWGAFGENLTISGWDDRGTYAGDIYKIGSCELQAVQPRQPCFKLGVKFGDMAMLKRFQVAGRWGVYFRVNREGTIAPGDEMVKIFEHPARFSVGEMFDFVNQDPVDVPRLKQILAIDCLAPGWRNKFSQRLAELEN